MTLSLTVMKHLKWLSSLPILMQKSFRWGQPRSDRYIVSLFPHLHTSFPPFSPSLISLMVSVDVKHHVYLLTSFVHLLRIISLRISVTYKSRLLILHERSGPRSVSHIVFFHSLAFGGG